MTISEQEQQTNCGRRHGGVDERLGPQRRRRSEEQAGTKRLEPRARLRLRVDQEDDRPRHPGCHQRQDRIGQGEHSKQQACAEGITVAARPAGMEGGGERCGQQGRGHGGDLDVGRSIDQCRVQCGDQSGEPREPGAAWCDFTRQPEDGGNQQPS